MQWSIASLYWNGLLHSRKLHVPIDYSGAEQSMTPYMYTAKWANQPSRRDRYLMQVDDTEVYQYGLELYVNQGNCTA